MHNLKFLRTISCAAAALLGVAMAHADAIPIGSSLTFGGTNTPDTYSETTTFGTTSLLDGGAVSLTTFEVPTAGGGDWAVWEMKTTSGAPVAGNINGYWDIEMDYVLSEPVYFDQVASQFTMNGTPFTLTGNVGGICCATPTNPSPLTGWTWYNSGFSGAIPAGSVNNWQEIYIDPFNFAAAGGVDPSTANGFNFALHFSPQSPVPEPAEFAPLLAVGLGLVVLARRRKMAYTAGATQLSALPFHHKRCPIAYS
jgi:hypothetical protein